MRPGGLWRIVATLFALLGFTGTMTHAQNLNTAPVRRIVFDNGLTLLVREDHSAPVVTAQAWVRAGSITEGDRMGAGLSHVLEHMLFKGTAKRGVAQIAHEIEDNGGYINAYTSFEQTVYYINLPSDNWKSAVDILADCMQHASIPEDELLKEKQVILREMAMGVDDPGRRASRTLWATAYQSHPYRHPIIGYPEIYNLLTRDDVVAYYRKKYVPNNLVFAVVGDVNAVEVETFLRDATKDFKRAPAEPAFIPAEPPQLSTRRRDEEMAVNVSRLYLAWHVPALTHPDVYALDVLGMILGQGRSSRLYREVQQKRGLVHSIDAGCYTPGQPGLFIIDALTDPDKREAAIAAIQEQVRSAIDPGVSDDEIQKAIKMSTAQHLDKFKTMEGQASDLANNEILVGDPNFSDRYLANLSRVTRADVQRVAREYLTDANLTLTSLNPVGSVATNAVAGRATNEIRIQKFDLANGIRLLVREDPKLPVVDIQALLKGGVIAETGENNGVTKLMARTLLKGTKTRTAEQIAGMIESVGGEISYHAGNNSFGVTAHALSADTDLALELVADVLLNPTFPQDRLDRERDTQLAEIKSEQDQILRAAQQLLREALFTRHPYRLNALGKTNTVPGLTRANVVDFHRRFVAPNNLVIAVFGDVKADEIRKKVEARFGSMKPVKLEFPPTGPETLANVVRRQENKPKEQAVMLLGFSGTDIFNPDRYALELLDTAYSGQGSRLFRRIRDELGLCYYVGAYQLLGLEPGYFAFYVGTTPDNVATCEREFYAELEKLKTGGLSDEELARAKAAVIGQHKVSLQDNAQVAMTAGLDELYGLGYEYFQTMDDRFRAVTMEDIKRVAVKYLADKPHAVVVVRPEENKK